MGGLLVQMLVGSKVLKNGVGVLIIMTYKSKFLMRAKICFGVCERVHL